MLVCWRVGMLVSYGLYGTVRAEYGAVGSGLVWSGLVWSGLVWSGLVWSGTYVCMQVWYLCNVMLCNVM